VGVGGKLGFNSFPTSCLFLTLKWMIRVPALIVQEWGVKQLTAVIVS